MSELIEITETNFSTRIFYACSDSFFEAGWHQGKHLPSRMLTKRKQQNATTNHSFSKTEGSSACKNG